MTLFNSFCWFFLTLSQKLTVMLSTSLLQTAISFEAIGSHRSTGPCFQSSWLPSDEGSSCFFSAFSNSLQLLSASWSFVFLNIPFFYLFLFSFLKYESRCFCSCIKKEDLFHVFSLNSLFPAKLNLLYWIISYPGFMLHLDSLLI